MTRSTLKILYDWTKLGNIDGWFWDNRGTNACDEQSLKLNRSTTTKDFMIFRTNHILFDTVSNEDVVMTLLENLPPSYEQLITILETMAMKELTTKYVMVCLMHMMCKGKEKKNPIWWSHNNIVLRQMKQSIFILRY